MSCHIFSWMEGKRLNSEMLLQDFIEVQKTWNGSMGKHIAYDEMTQNVYKTSTGHKPNKYEKDTRRWTWRWYIVTWTLYEQRMRSGHSQHWRQRLLVTLVWRRYDRISLSLTKFCDKSSSRRAEYRWWWGYIVFICDKAFFVLGGEHVLCISFYKYLQNYLMCCYLSYAHSVCAGLCI